LVNGAPICCEWLSEHAQAIVEAWEPGLLGGMAVAEVLFGAHNPSGKLALTFPRSAGHIKTYAAQRPSSVHRGRFKFWAHEPLYPFGHGLSYTSFAYSALRTQDTLCVGEALELELEIENTGTRAGEELVLVSVQDLFASVTRPVQELKAIGRVFLEPGERQTLRLVLPPEAFALLDADLKITTEPGEFRIVIGQEAASKTILLQSYSASAVPDPPISFG
jgi:beta-glucosidase